MTPLSAASEFAQQYELRFTSLHHEGRALVFPCDHAGQVDCDGLNERARNNYFYARSTVGRDFSMPRVDSIALAY